VREGNVSRHEPLHEFLKHGWEEIVQRITSPIQRITLEFVEGFNIARDVQKKMDRASLVMIAKRALSYIGLSGELVTLHRPPNFLCGNDDPSITNLKSLEALLSDASSQNRISFGTIIRTPEMDHLLIFYTEQGLLYMDENLMSEELFHRKYREVLAKDKYEIHTRKGGKIHFDVCMERRKQEAEKLLKIAKDLFSSKDGKESEIFEVTQEGFIFRYVDSIGIHSSWAVDRQGVGVITSDETIFELFKAKVTKRIQEVGEEEFRKRVNQHIRWTEANQDQGAARKEAEYYKNIVLEFFSS
jgi:hypothetical protein